MALIPAQQKFHTLTSSTVTQDLGSARANSGREVYTMQDIIDTVNTGSSGIDGFGVQYAVPVFTAFKTVSSLGIGTTGQVLTSAGPGSNPSFQTPAQSVDGFGQPFEMPVWQDFDTLTSIGGGQTGQVLTSTGPGSNPSFQTPAQSVDGFGQPFEMPVWQDFDTLTSIGIGTAGQVLTSAGPGANPSFQTPSAGGNPLEEVVVIGGVASLSKTVEIPANATDAGTFMGQGITSLILNTGLVTIKPNAFYGNALTSVSLPSTVAGIIGQNAFSGNFIIGSISIPSGVTTIDDGAFGPQFNESTAGITSLTFSGTSLTTIGANAFRSSRIASLAFPSSLTLIENSAFEGSGVGGTDTLTSISFASAITIQDKAFHNLFGGTTLTIPNNSVIQGFSSSSNLTTLNLGTGVTLGNDVFKDCTSLGSIVTLPSGTVLVNGSQFEGCTSLNRINMPNTITIIPEDFAKGCTTLNQGTNFIISGGPHSSTFGAQIVEFKTGSFDGCTALPSTVTFPTVCTIANGSFINTGITTANIKTGSAFSGSGVFPPGTTINFI